jgi:DnaJ family protein C protein 28
MAGTPIDEIIRRAIEEGKFDGLPGKGKPLHLDENPHLDPAWRAAYHLLKSSGYSLPWIETLREIESDLATARADLARVWKWRVSARENPANALDAEAEWQRAVLSFREQVHDLNRRIRDYNLVTPSDQFQRIAIDADREIELVKAM